MKALAIAFKDLSLSFRSFFALAFMFGVPLLITGLFYFMLGNAARQGEFNLPRVSVVVANLDQGGPRLRINARHIPGGVQARTLGELVVGILASQELADLLQTAQVADAAAARLAVDNRQAQVALIIPADFSVQFADLNGQAVIELYQDPTLSIGPGIVRCILSQFMDGMSGVKIAVNIVLGSNEAVDEALVGQVAQRYLELSNTQTGDPQEILLDVRPPRASANGAATDPLLSLLAPIMGGMLIFYAFYTGAASAQSILKEDEERTLPRLFTTPTPRPVILSGKFLAVFLTVLVQVAVLLTVSWVVFRIRWGAPLLVCLVAAGLICAAASFGIFVNSLLKSSRQGAVIFGGIVAFTGMLGMIGIFGGNGLAFQGPAGYVSLLAPQGWAVRGLLQSLNGLPAMDVLLSTLVLFAWSVVFFIVGAWRFNRRFA